MDMGQAHKSERQQGVVEEPHTQALRAVGQKGGGLCWEKMWIANEYALNMWYLKKAQEYDRWRRGEESLN